MGVGFAIIPFGSSCARSAQTKQTTGATPRSPVTSWHHRVGILGPVRRRVHIWVSLIAVLLLLKPFDCFSSSKFTQKAADCCKKGKCVPSSKADDCCKGTLPGGKNLEVSKAPVHASPDLTVAAAFAHELPVPAFVSGGLADVHALPGSPPFSRLTLPLLI